MKEKTKIFVDGNCIVCDLEIAHYKRKAPEAFEIVNIADEQFDAKTYGLDNKAVQKHIHVFTPSNELLVGVDAFAHIWSVLPNYRWASILIKVPGIYQAAKIAYVIFAANRKYLPKKKRK